MQTIYVPTPGQIKFCADHGIKLRDQDTRRQAQAKINRHLKQQKKRKRARRIK